MCVCVCGWVCVYVCVYVHVRVVCSCIHLVQIHSYKYFQMHRRDISIL